MHALAAIAIIAGIVTLCFGLAYRGQRQLNRGLKFVIEAQAKDCLELESGKQFWRDLYGQIVDQLCDRVVERNAARRELGLVTELLEGQIYVNKILNEQLAELRKPPLTGNELVARLAESWVGPYAAVVDVSNWSARRGKRKARK